MRYSFQAKAKLKSKKILQMRSKAKNNEGKKYGQIFNNDYNQITHIQDIKTFKCDHEINKRLCKILFICS
ncbi:4232_t:CDS:2 [Funneliformis geosporum]|nr:4232_t:CDS:2 [Funneliformis geosporum]